MCAGLVLLCQMKPWCFMACVVTEVVPVCRARAIGYRQHNKEAVGGFFSQIGNLYMVHHLWGTVKYQQNYILQCHHVDNYASAEIFSCFHRKSINIIDCHLSSKNAPKFASSILFC